MTSREVIEKMCDNQLKEVSAFFLLFWLWILLAYAKRTLCGIEGIVLRQRSLLTTTLGNL